MRFRYLVLIALALALAGGVLAVLRQGDRTAATAAHRMGTTAAPPLSVAPESRGQRGRVPTPGELAALFTLRSAVDSAIARTGWRSVRWSILAVSLDRGDTLYARDPHVALAPASNMKLFTTALALMHLGPDYRFTTYLVTDGTIEAGVLRGNLYLYGTGDPTLGRRFQQTPADVLRAFADTLAALGIRRIEGDVVGDASYFEGSVTGAGWEERYINAWWAPPAGALSIHENVVRLEVRPAEQPGWRPILEFVPGGAGIAIVNLAVTGGGGRLNVVRHDYPGPIVVRGTLGAAVTHAVPVADPPRYAAAVFRDLLEEQGFTVTGSVLANQDPDRSPLSRRRVFAPRFDGDPTARILAVGTSEPLREILRVINHESHNFYAEQVLRAAARAAVGEGSVAGGHRAVAELLHGMGADTWSLRVEDGSGLSPLNRASAAQFVALLRAMAASPCARELEQSLPVAGEARRFRRMMGTPAEGNLRAKTGTIARVSSLSGYVTTADGERVAFAILGNDVPSTPRAKSIEDLIGARLAGFRREGPPLEDESAPEPDTASGAAAR